ncbi:hypothetical protein GOFOIKOB_5806 [Methylobacterium tardum]|nr:hypothetical protein GOFOIKOB_5806 [Methylobacterium tardum]
MENCRRPFTNEGFPGVQEFRLWHAVEPTLLLRHRFDQRATFVEQLQDTRTPRAALRCGAITVNVS